MNAQTQRLTIQGPAGLLAVAVDEPATPPLGVAVVCHPHPLHGGTLDNKVAQTLARAFVACGWRAVRFNFRGVKGSEGQWDGGVGEVDDALAVAAHQRLPGLPLRWAGFSFGGFVAAQAAAQGADAPSLLVAPAVVNFPMPTVSQDTALVHGEADDVVALADVLDWARPQALPVTVFPGAGHFFHGQLALLKTWAMRAVAADPLAIRSD
ncbi:MAG: alpha/beta hydrolase [Proteobacteria bacterium]|nr:alpha/beta hydrolase [Pseudomonadota bacterium]